MYINKCSNEVLFELLASEFTYIQNKKKQFFKFLKRGKFDTKFWCHFTFSN